MRLEDIDLYTPEGYLQGVPHQMLKLLRAEAPVYFHAEPGGPGFWALTRYDDIVMVSKDPGTYSSARGATNIKDLPPEDLSVVQTLMLNMDPPQHVKFRRLVSQGFTPRMTAKLEPGIRAEVDSIIDAVAARGRCDFVREIAAELPLRAIAQLLGVPYEDRDKLFHWSNSLIGFDDPEFQNSFEDGQIAAMELWTYANELCERRAGMKQDALINVLMDAHVDGEKLSEQEFDSFFLLLAVAGNETTRNLISGAMQAFFEHPEQWQRLRENPDLLPSAVEEMLRWVTPVMYFRRTATRDVVLRGQHIKEGDKVVMYYNSGNRDEAVYTHPDTFDVGRTPNEHLAFGIGEHFCLGNSLARLEIRLIFEGLLKRLPDIRPDGPVKRLRSNFINGIKSMPVAFSPESA